ncbi:ComEC family competence protein [compost metagenome]
MEAAPRRVSLIQLLRWNDRLRDALGGRMDHIFPARHAGFMKSMLIGQQDDLDPQRFQQFSELGLTHILAISGLNVAVFLGVCIWFMRKMRLTKETYLLISILLLPPYILLTGASPSIVRAGLMAMIALYAVRRGILKDALHLTAIVAWLMLLWDPYYLLDVGFQLSFLVTLGLIVCVPRVSRLIPLSSTVVTNTLSITIVSQLISFPISIYYFNQFSLLSWVANAILVPVISLVVFPAGLLALAAGTIYLPLGQGFGWLLAWLNDLIFWSTDQLQQLRGFRMIWPTPSFLWIVAYYALIGILYAALNRRQLLRESAGDKTEQLNTQEVAAASAQSGANHPPYPIEYIPVMLSASSSFAQKFPNTAAHNPYRQTRLFLILALSALAVLLYIGYTPERWNRHGLVQFMDVGQGDSILIRTPQGRHLLIDGGGTLTFRKPGEEWKDRKDPYEVGRKLLVPLLKKRGVHQLDMVILTHEDMDHSGGLQAVVEQIPVKQFLFNGTYKANDQISKLFGTVLDRTIPLVKAEYGSTIAIEEGTTLQILYPFMDREPVVTLENKQNDQSIVFLLHMGGLNWLFTGDMEKSSEDELLKALKGTSAEEEGGRRLSSIDVLKIAHHGSKTSTSQAWLDYWNPKIAVISVGESNSYGHPSPEVIERIQQSDTRIFRTDQMGEVQLETQDGGLYARMKLVDAEIDNK